MPSKEQKKSVVMESEQIQEELTSGKEPLPENSQENIAENKSQYNSYEEVIKVIRELQSEINSRFKQINSLQKEADKFHSKTVKEAKKKHKRSSSFDANRKPSGFEAPVQIPEKFYEFVRYGLDNNRFTEEKTKDLIEKDLSLESKIPRSLVTKIAYDYIKNLDLYSDNKEDKRKILPDEHIRQLFDIKEDETIEFSNFQTYVSRLFPKKQKVESDGESDNDVGVKLEQVSDEEVIVENAKTKSKTKSKTGTVSASI